MNTLESLPALLSNSYCGVRPSFAVIIATRDRPKDLQMCIESIFQQSLLPEELIVVDSSMPKNRNQNREYLKLFNNKSVSLLLLETDRHSLPYQRNLGIERATGEFVFFFDDDVVLLEGFFEEMIGVFVQYERTVMGLGGVAVNDMPTSFLNQIARIIFLPGSAYSKYAQGVQRSGFGYRKSAGCERLQSVQALTGYCMGYRIEVLRHFQFDENLKGYALCEDLEFSYRVSEKYPLYRLVNAKIIHQKSPVNRLDNENLKKMFIQNSHYIFKKHFSSNRLNFIFFSWALFGRFCVLSVKSILNRDFSGLRGFFGGIKEILSKRP